VKLLVVRMQLIVFLSGLALLWFGVSRPASSNSHGASVSAENVPVAVLPFEYFKNHIFVTVQIDGSGQYSCMVDNGLNTDAITERAARAMKLPSHAAGGKTPNAKGLGEGSGPEIFVADNSVVLGVRGFPILTGQVLVLDTSAMEKAMGRPIDCTIGSPLFDRFVVAVDFTKRQLTLYDAGSFTYSGQGHSVPLKVAAPPSVEAEVFTQDGRKVKATVGIDLGSDVSFDFWPAFQSKHHILEARQPELAVASMGLAGGLRESMARLPYVDFAGFKIEKPIAVFQDTARDPGLSKSDGAVGNGLLQRFTVIFDYSRRRLILEPNSSFGDPFTANMTGIGADPYSDPTRGFEVRGVQGGSVAAIAGIRSGDKVVEINGVLSSTLTFESFHQMLTAEGAPFKLKVERSGEKIEISFQTPRLP
jgi:PDZ domain